ncbi:MAG: FHA domain-containing protein [Planctomycetota bacterium]
MNPTVCIELLSGPDAGLRHTFTGDTLVFGRSADCDIAVDTPEASRHHGELRFADGCWIVFNGSDNGTTVGGRKVHPERGRVLRAGDVVGVGRHGLFTVVWADAGDVAPGEEETVAEMSGELSPSMNIAVGDAAAAGPGGEKMSRRAKVWIGIGIYMVVMMVIALIVMGVRNAKENGPGGVGQQAPVLTDAQIAAAITAPLTREFDERSAARHIAEARAWYDRAETVSDGLYTTYHHYQLALAYANRDAHEAPEDHLRFKAVEKKLIAKVQADYRDATSAHRLRDWSNAEAQWRALAQSYRATEGPIYENVQARLKEVIAQRPTRRVFR